MAPPRTLQSCHSLDAASFIRMLYVHVQAALMLPASLDTYRPFGLHLQHTARCVCFSSALSEPGVQLLLASGRLKLNGWCMFQSIGHALERLLGAHCLRLAVYCEVHPR